MTHSDKVILMSISSSFGVSTHFASYFSEDDGKKNLYTNKPHSSYKNGKNHFWHYKSQKISRGFVNEIKNNLSSKGSNMLFDYCYYLSRAMYNRKENENIKSRFCAIKTPLKKLFKDINKNENFTSYEDVVKAYAWRYERSSTFSNIYFLANDAGLLDVKIDNLETTFDITIGLMNRFFSPTYNRKYQIAEFAAIKNHSGYVLEDMANIKKVIDLIKLPFSERDIMLDLYLNCIYNDEFFPLSCNSPLVMYDKENFSTHYTYRFLAKRWNISLGKVHNVLNKFKKLGYIEFKTVPNHGTYIFVNAYSKFLWNIESITPAYFDIVKDASVKNCISIYSNYFYNLFNNLKKDKKSMKSIIEKLNKKFFGFLSFLKGRFLLSKINQNVKNYNKNLRSTFFGSLILLFSQKTFILQRFHTTSY